MSDVWDGGIPADAFEDILRRIPPCPRRRLRLVCRHWRDAIDERTPEPRASSSETKVLAFFTDQTNRSRAYVFDDLTAAGRSRELDLQESSSVDADGAAIVSMIGTCNGLLCLRRKRGDIVVTNLIIGETVAVDLPPAFRSCYDTSFSFGYHPATGQYKIVHRPVSRRHAMCVLTLGEGRSSWREVPVPHGSTCCLLYGLVTIDGITYWTTRANGGERIGIVSFDLKDERVSPVDELPPVPAPVLVPQPYVGGPSFKLTDVGGRLGLVVSSVVDSKTDVWVLEDGRDELERAWVKRCTVLGACPPKVAMPHVVHGGHVLTTRESRKLVLRAHQPRRDEEVPSSCGMVWVGAPQSETTVAAYEGSRSMRVFAYVETREPLLVYGDSPRRSMRY